MTPTPAYRWYPQAPAMPVAHTPATPVYYTHTTMTGELVTLTGAEIAARRHTDRVLHARWVVRQAELRERDRRARRFWAGLGATVGAGLILAAAGAGWAIVNAGAGTWLLAALIATPLLAVAVPVGHKCVTIVQHWH